MTVNYPLGNSEYVPEYSGIQFTYFVGSDTPDTGKMSPQTLLSSKMMISCTIDCRNISDYKDFYIKVVGKKVKTKYLRSKTESSKSLQTSSVFYRSSKLEEDISMFSAVNTLTDQLALPKLLLLNDQNDTKDSSLGDCAIQAFLCLENEKGKFEFFLSPGSGYKDLLFLLGLTLTDSNVDIQKFIESTIVDKIASLVMSKFIPAMDITPSISLSSDIRRYILYSITGK